MPSRTYAGSSEREEPLELVEERPRLRLGEHVVAHAWIGAGERPQLVDPVRVGQEATVEHEVDVDREPVLVAERHDAGLERAGAVVLVEELAQAVAQLVHVELACRSRCRRGP